MVDDPHNTRVSGETTDADDLSPFGSDAFSGRHSAVASTLDRIDDLIETDDLGPDGLGPDALDPGALDADVLAGDDLEAEPLLVSSADVEVIVTDGPVLDGRVTAADTGIGWIAPTDADLLLEAEEADPVVALAFADRPSVDGEAAAETMARPDDTEGLEDHVRMYLREIGLVPLLSWDGEKRLARRMEEGLYLERLAREFAHLDREATALEVMGEIVRRFEDRIELIGHWFPSLEQTIAGYRSAIATLGDTAEISVERCQEFADKVGAAAEVVREDLVELSTLCRLVPDEVRDWVADRRASGDSSRLSAIVGRALLVDPRELAEHLGWVQFEAERARASPWRDKA
mgnify:CR=1 FL=1